MPSSVMSELQCIVVTPEQTVRSTSADFVALTLFDGEIGIAPGHTPLIGRLGAGEMRITQEGKTARYYVEGGFVEVVDNVVSVLTRRAVAAETLDRVAVAESIEAARARKAATPDEAAAREAALAQGLVQMRIIRRRES